MSEDTVRDCRYCGRPFADRREGRGRPREYCGDECREKGASRAQDERRSYALSQASLSEDPTATLLEFIENWYQRATEAEKRARAWEAKYRTAKGLPPLDQ